MTNDGMLDFYSRALCIWREGRGNQQLWIPVWWTIQNRLVLFPQQFGRTISEVVFKPYAFSSFNAADLNSRLIPNPFNPVDWRAWSGIVDLCYRLEQDVGGKTGVNSDPTNGAIYYESMPDDALPAVQKHAWFSPGNVTLTVPPAVPGKPSTRFYRAGLDARVL